MGFRDIWVLRKLGLGMISFTGFLVIFFALCILASAYYSEPPLMTVISSEPIGRKPDSVAPVFVVDAPDLSSAKMKIETLSLGCLRNGLQMEVKSTARQVRIKGKFCNGAKGLLDTSQIINRSNGFEATLYDLESNEFTSDLISLAEGKNNIWLQMDAGVGKSLVGELVILREPGSG